MPPSRGSDFHESPSWLAATVASAAKLCDHIVAVDGRYLLYNHAMPVSPVQEAQTIVETAEGAGIGLTLHRPDGPFWGNEVEKRSLMARLALASATPMEDWIVVLDGDCYIRHVNKERVRWELENTDLHVAEYAAEEYMDPHNPDQPLDIALHRHLETVFQTPVRCVYRALPNLRHEGTHYSVCGEVDGEKTWLWGHKDQVDALRLTEDLVVRHRNALRTVERRLAAATYYEQREILQIEEMVD